MLNLIEKNTEWEIELLNALEAYNHQYDVRVPINLDETDRWVCASAMQKAVRRGQKEMAIKAGMALLSLKPTQLWSRLAIIVQEDIGSANIVLVGMVLWVSGKKAWRSSHGGDVRVLQCLLSLMCDSLKSRLANDLLCIANYHADYKKDAHDYFMYSDDFLADIIKAPTYTLPQKAIASCYIAGVQPRDSFHLHPRRGSHKALFRLYCSMGYQGDVLSVINMGLNKGEGHARVIGLSHQSHINAEDRSIVNQCEQTPTRIGDWYSESYDAHTRVGQYAYREFIKRNRRIHHILEKHFPEKNHVAIVGMIVFGLEGQRMNNRVTYSEVDDLTHTALEAYVDEDYKEEIRMLLEDLVEEKMEDIHTLRARYA